MSISTLLLILILAITKVACQGSLSANQTIEQNLIQALLTNYNKNVKPVVNSIKIIKIKKSIKLYLENFFGFFLQKRFY
jgi:hypothetical protein